MEAKRYTWSRAQRRRNTHNGGERPSVLIHALAAITGLACMGSGAAMIVTCHQLAHALVGVGAIAAGCALAVAAIRSAERRGLR